MRRILWSLALLTLGTTATLPAQNAPPCDQLCLDLKALIYNGANEYAAWRGTERTKFGTISTFTPTGWCSCYTHDGVPAELYCYAIKTPVLATARAEFDRVSAATRAAFPEWKRREYFGSPPSASLRLTNEANGTFIDMMLYGDLDRPTGKESSVEIWIKRQGKVQSVRASSCEALCQAMRRIDAGSANHFAAILDGETGTVVPPGAESCKIRERDWTYACDLGHPTVEEGRKVYAVWAGALLAAFGEPGAGWTFHEESGNLGPVLEGNHPSGRQVTMRAFEVGNTSILQFSVTAP
jgi:hypothetical protein